MTDTTNGVGEMCTAAAACFEADRMDGAVPSRSATTAVEGCELLAALRRLQEDMDTLRREMAAIKRGVTMNQYLICRCWSPCQPCREKYAPGESPRNCRACWELNVGIAQGFGYFW